MATHCTVLAWRIPWTEEPGGLQSIELQSQTGLSNFTSLHFTLHTPEFSVLFGDYQDMEFLSCGIDAFEL